MLERTGGGCRDDSWVLGEVGMIRCSQLLLMLRNLHRFTRPETLGPNEQAFGTECKADSKAVLSFRLVYLALLQGAHKPKTVHFQFKVWLAMI
jgi:hypothetical protein